MHQREKIQVVFESVELEKEELKSEREALNFERKKLADDRILLKEAVEKISGINTTGAADISHAANKINTIKINTEKLQEESIEAINSIKKQNIFSSFIASFIIMLLSLIVGLSSAHIIYKELLETKVLASQIESLRLQKEEFEYADLSIKALKKNGFKIYSDGIILPYNYREILRRTDNDQVFIPLTQ